MENLKFNIGDKVILLQLQYFDNPYHYKLCVSEYTVKGASAKWFRLFGEKIESFIPGMDKWDYRYQESGKQLYGNEIVYHKEKDAEEIKRHICDAIVKWEADRNVEDLSRKNQLKSIIQSAQDEIDLIDKGEGNFKKGFSTVNRNEFRDKVVAEIYKYFPLTKS